MSKYIDADKIRSEVERIQETGCESPISVCNDILSFIDFLQQEQHPLDLDADIEMEWNSFNKHLVKYEEGSEEVIWLNWISFIDIASHFYELGLKEK